MDSTNGVFFARDHPSLSIADSNFDGRPDVLRFFDSAALRSERHGGVLSVILRSRRGDEESKMVALLTSWFAGRDLHALRVSPVENLR